jgi:uncharacterized OB-fold protein
MTTIAPAEGRFLKPLPEVTDYNAPFVAGLRNHQFLVPKCQACGHYSWIPHPACRSCLSERLVWTPVSGDATLYTFTVVHRGPGAFSLEVPYVIAMGELVEGPRACVVLGNLVGTSPDDLFIGMPLRIAYQDIPEEGETMWRWTVPSVVNS